MREKIVVTIARSYGSRGREIGEKLAKELGVPFYDRSIIRLAAEKSGIDERLVESADEKIIDRLIDPYAIAGGMINNTNDQIYRVESKIIRELAEKESCVIVGRLADWVLREFPNTMNVFIYAPKEERIRTVMERENLSESQAKKLIKQMDKVRRGYYAYFTDRDWDGIEGRDLMVNSSLQGVDKTVALLKYAAVNF